MASQLLSPNSWPPPSALTAFIAANAAATSKSAETSSHDQLRHLALQVQHQLIHQFDWTNVHLHTHTNTLYAALRGPDPQERKDKSSSGSSNSSKTAGRLPRPLLTGTPPRPLYTHPDIQVALIKTRKVEADLPIEPVVVCPAHISEGGWSLDRMSSIFDRLPQPERSGLRDVLGDVKVNGKGVEELDREKRVLLAVVEADSTVVYYWVHDGIVKPRQN